MKQVDANMSEGPQPAGWYPAQGDPPGTQRWWDGEMWVGDAVPSPVPAAGSGMPSAPRSFAEQSEAVLALVLGILGFVCCQLTSPFAWKIGQRELDAIDAGRRDPKDRGLAMAGKILGIIGSAFLALIVVVLVVQLIILLVASVSA